MGPLLLLGVLAVSLIWQTHCKTNAEHYFHFLLFSVIVKSLLGFLPVS